MNTAISTRTSNRIAAGVTAAYLHDLSSRRRRRATAATRRSVATASPPACAAPRRREGHRRTEGS